MVKCEGCGSWFGPEEVEVHFSKFWCPPCEMQLLDSYDSAYNDEYYNSEEEWNDLMDAEADAFHSQWDNDPNPYEGTYDDNEGVW